MALRFAGENRGELEKVLAYYQDDRLKYKSACFLIENMPHYYSYGEDAYLDTQANSFDHAGKIYDSPVITAVDLSDLALTNVEALAYGEGTCPNGCVDGNGGCYCYVWYSYYKTYGW
jgi:hypothetical protein